MVKLPFFGCNVCAGMFNSRVFLSRRSRVSEVDVVAVLSHL